LLQALVEDLQLSSEAAPQLVAQLLAALLALERCQPLHQILVVASAEHLLDGSPGHEQTQVHPREAPETVGLRLEARRGRAGTVELELDNRSASLRESVVQTPVGDIQSGEQFLYALVPVGRGGRQRTGSDHPLESRVGRKQKQVPELEPGAHHPEAGVQQPEESEGADADPVGRDEHAERSGVERRGKVVEEPWFGRHLSVWTSILDEERAGGKCLGAGSSRRTVRRALLFRAAFALRVQGRGPPGRPATTSSSRK
jgi:hypothetical protein